jgi:hypothetical protein
MNLRGDRANEAAEQIEERKRHPLHDVRPVTIDDNGANVARAMSFQPEPDSATALRERAQSFGRGAVQGFRQALTADPWCQDSRQRAVAGPPMVERKRLRQTLHQVTG